MIKIDFEFDSSYGIFRDALHLPDDHYLSDAEIQAMKQQRFDNWRAVVSDSSEVSKLIDVPNVLTPSSFLPALLAAAEITAQDVFYDLGCSAGAVVIETTKTYGCTCVGVEASDFRFNQAQARVALENLQDRITIRHEDLYTADLTGATVVYLYLSPESNQQLEQRLFGLPIGTKLVSYAYDFPGRTPVKTVEVGGHVGRVWVTE